MKIQIFLLLAFFCSSQAKLDNPILNDYDKGIEQSKTSGKPIFLLFTGTSCSNNITFNEIIKNNSEISEIMERNFIPVILNCSDPTRLKKPYKVSNDRGKRIIRTKGHLWAHLAKSKFGTNAMPTAFIIDSDENVMKEPLTGRIDKEQLLNFLRE